MSAVNFDDALTQLQEAGLLVTPADLVIGMRRRCQVKDGGREKRGWYQLYELPCRDGSGVLIVGSFGVFWGAENIVHKISIKRGEGDKLSAEQREAIKKRIAEDRKRVEREETERAERAAQRAAHAWHKHCTGDGHCEYLDRKQIKAHGVRFSPSGNMVIPLFDARRVTGLQVIYGDPKIKAKKGRDKDFWPAGLAKKGRYFLIGGYPRRTEPVLICEGYATGASLFEATNRPVVVAFDAGNLLPVGEAIRQRFKCQRIVFCADDDYRTAGNPGVSHAQAAALALDAKSVQPVFSVERPVDQKGPTDFNDLHCLEGLHVVTAQIETSLTAWGWSAPRAPAWAPASGGAGKPALKGLLDVDEACARYSLIYGAGGSMFDHEEHILVPKSDVMDVLVDHGWREWKLREDRKVARISEVGFDPGGKDSAISCNLWGGWPTKPRAGRCEALLDLLRYLCAEEDDPDEIYHWLLCWLAYPIQNPGAKMKTALVMHGPQGAGKNMFFEAVMSIYGEYGSIVDQSAVEDKFNDWASRKLFMIADEVVARQELYHVKNKLKHLITGDAIRINPKNVAAHVERNHVNLVFLSNETQPLVLERDDRRYAVIWTPEKLSYSFYDEVSDEIADGGVAALHDYLLHYAIGDFAAHTNPPKTKAKTELIELSMDSTERFWTNWTRGQLDGVPVCPAKSEDVYKLYRAWCSRNGIVKPAAAHILLGNLGKRRDCIKSVERYLSGASEKQATFLFPPLLDDQGNRVDPPPAARKKQWLTECALSFVEGVRQWRGVGNDDY